MKDKVKTIKIFAIDSFIRESWPLPFIRIGTGNCNSILNCKIDASNVENYGLPISETAPLLFIVKHLKDFGNPDYVGVCHYRRYFTISTRQALIQFKQEFPDKSAFLLPEEQLLLILLNKADGIIPYPFIEHYHTNSLHIALSFYEEAYMQGIEDNVKLSLDDYKQAFLIFENNIPIYLKVHINYAFSQRRVYFGTISTLKKEIFEEYSNILVKSIIEVCKAFGRDKLLSANCRCGGYLLERMSSCLLYMYLASGRKFLHLPLLVANSDSMPKYRSKTTAEANLKCDLSKL